MRFNFTERGVIAFAVIVCCTTLILSGKDSIVGYSMLAVICGYFGIEIIPPKITKWRQNGKAKGGTHE